ncbi:outer membrane protein transport protein [Moraxella sp. ZJ142]|uniref:outer membrane protein transport protein n=1 Tax=Moraxella marmotae TaxID=3344520 RepID=UPI0035D3E62D
MSLKFGYKALSIAVASTLTATAAHAAGMDRSGQDITAFLQDGTYAEAVYTYIDADVAGKDIAGKPVSDVAEAYDFFRYGVKTDINDTFSVGVLYDEPFGAAVQYRGDNNFVANGDATTQALVKTATPAIQARLEASSALTPGQKTAYKELLNQLAPTITSPELAHGTADLVRGNPVTKGIADTLDTIANTADSLDGQGTNVEIRTNNITMLVGAKLGANKNFQVYGGPAAQRLNGEVHLRGTAYSGMNGYDARIATDTQVGWVAGVAYHKPEIALKAALTYRSEIEHESTIAETVPVLALRGLDTHTNRDFKVTLPESWNLDFQTGINPTTLLTAKVRYVPWADFDIRPPTYGDTTKVATGTSLPIVSYSKDQWSAELGLGKRVSDRLAVSGSVGYDSGAGNPASTLGPIKGYYSVGLGAKYNVTPQWSLAVGGKYLKFGDATAQVPTGAKVGEFADNDGYIVGVKLAYQAK